ncbi:hypothetical protein RND81_10G133600 [Saponaria officinalis]|uniref:Poly(A) RNA polymerase mitochondrial-like central palm domain-containing protein n=1 Tax=Saponaria officinalis TaxID=3572 RepID=A0AAW1I1L2_SAPOF
MLEATLNEILYVVNPLKNDVEIRMRIISELRDVVSSIESLKGATVEPFGSFLSQLFSRWGDLDISIELSNGLHIMVPAKKHKQKLLGDLLKALRRTGSFWRLQFVSHARVPILKLESKIQNISCDISVNNLTGHMKSKFMLWISLIDSRFRDMVLLVKEWAKANNINNPRSGTFNSYSLSLLVIFHFQTCAPPILPPLKDLYPGNMADELIGIRADMERRIEEIAVSNIARFRKHRRANHCSLPELFISFLGKFLDISTRTTEQGVCTYSGQWENVSTNTRWLPKTHPIIIEDPFEQPENSARAVSQSQLARIAHAFNNTYNLLIDPYQNRNTLIPSLVRPEISRFFPGAAFVIPRANFWPYPWSNQNAPHGSHSSSPSQPQFQKMRQAKLNQPKNSKGRQNGKQPSPRQGHTVNQQLQTERPISQQLSVDRPNTGQQWHGQAPRPVLPQIVTPPWPHTLQPSSNSGAPQWPFKVSPAAQAQQIWRQK